MREILFRGKSKKLNGSVGGWVFGGIHWRNNSSGEVETLIIQNGFGECGDRSYILYREVVPSTVGQYTGLTDSAGAKIFEGDVLHAIEEGGTSSILVTVIWNEEYSRFDLNEDLTGYPEESSLVYLMEAYEYVYLLWNDDDNPDLLEGGES